MDQNQDLVEKKLLGSGGYAFAKLTKQEEIKGSLGVPQIFIGNIGRLNEDRFINIIAVNVQRNILALQ